MKPSARGNSAVILAAVSVVAVGGLSAAEQLVAVTPLALGAVAAGRTAATLVLVGAVASWLDRRRVDLAQRVDENHSAVVREVGRLRWLDRDVDRERVGRRRMEQDTAEIPVAALRQLAAVRGRLENLEGRMEGIDGRLAEMSKAEDRAAGWVDAVRSRYNAGAERNRRTEGGY